MYVWTGCRNAFLRALPTSIFHAAAVACDSQGDSIVSKTVISDGWGIGSAVLEY
mgnify:CR=1